MSFDLSAIPALLNYDSAVDWTDRLALEGPFLRSALAAAPSQRIVDLGAGTGEHAHWLAGQGFTVVGIEGVKERWEAARAAAPAGAQHLLGDLGAVEAMVRGHFGAAICLGNTLPAVLGTEALSRMLVGLRRRLLPGGVFVAQQLNYDGLYRRNARELPERGLRRGDDELVFRRALELRADGVVAVSETVLHRRGGQPAAGVHQRHLFQQGWLQHQLQTLLDVAGFREVAFFGGYAGEKFDPDSSAELLLRAS